MHDLTMTYFVSLLLAGALSASAASSSAVIPAGFSAAQAVPEKVDPLLDTLVIGDPGSEREHGFKADQCQREAGGLGDPALRLVPNAAKPWESLPLEFTLKVDPKKQTYLTARFWGSDKGEDLGRLIASVDGKQLGYVGDGDYSVLNQADEDAEAPGCFFYQTLPLPPALTQGKSSVAVKIVARGRAWSYGANFDQFQKPLTSPSRGLYRFYTHADGCFEPPAGEKQGERPRAAVRPGPGEEVLEKSRAIVLGRLKSLLDREPGRSAKSIEMNLPFLAAAYNAEWTPAYHNPKTIDRIVQLGDAQAQAFFQDPKAVTGTWLGAGPLGEAILKTWPGVESRLDEKVRMGEAEMTRREAWGKMLKGGMDYWRTHRRNYTNQSMIVDRNIYTANRGLALIRPVLALPEKEALRYVYEAIGLSPWLGSDIGGEVSGEKDVPFANVAKPFGGHYYLVTRKGLSRELGFVASYGETILRFTHDMAVLTGDEKVRQQLRKIANARLYFRYPSQDADGFRCMKLASEIDERKEHFPSPGAAYADNYSSRENWGMGLAAVLFDDPKTVGATQQSLEDNQYFALIESRLKSDDPASMLANLDEYAKVKALPPSAERLPMSNGQPDCVFSDEENAVLALKHGETRLFVNLYFRAENGVNRAARVFEITPCFNRIATVRTQVEVDESGRTFVRPDHLQRIRPGGEGLKPPGETAHQAWAGETMPIAKRPDDASQPEYGKWGPFVGKASFYWVRYGHYLIGLNTTEDKTFTLPAPAGHAQGQELVTSQKMALEGGIPVPPLSTRILYLE